jgi:AraC-like DNA-binding protein
MKLLADLLKLMQLEVSVYHNAKVCGDWQINEHEIGQTCFHMATESGFKLNIPDDGDYILGSGDLVIFPHEMPHSMKPSPALNGPQQHVAYSSELKGVGMLCGKVDFKHQASLQLLSALPHMLIVKNDESTPWLNHLLQLIQDESYKDENTTQVILDKLSELLFTYALRHYIQHNNNNVGMLALYADNKLNNAISAIHANPKKQWTLEQLAQISMLSRTGFSEIFKAVSGWTPMHYLTWWRMQLAWSLLQSGTSVALTADKIGYKSEAAFSRAFKKQFNISAGQIRRGFK